VTTLVKTDLETTLETDIRFSHQGRIHLAAIYPYLLKFGNPDGTFTLTLISSGDTVFSVDFSASDISSEDYAHSFFPIIPENPVQLLAGLYTIELSSSGYTHSESDYIAWIQQHEDLQCRPEYETENDSMNPLTVRIKMYKEGNL